jgi:ATP-dependent helicase HrpA
VADDIAAQLQRLVRQALLWHRPWAALQHLPRYLKGRGAAPGQAARRPGARRRALAELRPLEQRWLRRWPSARARGHARLDEYRWLLEELRVSLFAQELRTPQPVSVKRLDTVLVRCRSFAEDLPQQDTGADCGAGPTVGPDST